MTNFNPYILYMVNKVILIGNVGADPDVKYLEGGVAVARFSLATSEVYKYKNGERVTQTEWHNIVLWRNLAQIAEKYVRKGIISRCYPGNRITGINLKTRICHKHPI